MGLRKTIGLAQGIAIAVGMVIGSGLLGLPGMAISAVGEGTALLGWACVIVLMVPMLLVFIRLGLTYTTAAGLAKYAEIAAGPWASYGVTAVLCGTFSIGIPALALIGSAYACRLLGLPEAPWLHVLAIAFLLASTAMHAAGVRVASMINSLSLYLVIALVLAMVATNADALAAGAHVLGDYLAEPGKWDPGRLWLVMALLFWAFLGWENMSFGLEEFREPQTTIPLVYWFSFILVSAMYLALALVVTGAHASGRDASGIGGLSALLHETWLGTAMLLVMVFVIVANANSWVFGASRLIYSAGTKGILPIQLGKVSSAGIPLNSLLLAVVVYAAVLLLTLLFEIPVAQIVLVVSQNFLVLYGFSIVAYFRLVGRGNASLAIFHLSASDDCDALCFAWPDLLYRPHDPAAAQTRNARSRVIKDEG